MKRIIFTLFIAAIALCAQAQDDGGQMGGGQRGNRQGGQGQRSAQTTQTKQQTKEEKNKADIYKEKAEAWAETFSLSSETAAKFENLYIEWQEARMNIIDKYGFEQKAGADTNFKKISEADAEKMLMDDFDRQVKQAEADREYYLKFQEFVTPGHAAQIVMQQRNGAAGRTAQFQKMTGGRGMRGM